MQKNENRPGYKKTKVGWIPEGWEESTMEDIAQIERGKFSARPRNDPQFYGGKFPFLQTGDVSTSDGIVNGYSQTLNERGLTVSRLFPSGTLLITIAANIGDIAEVPFEFACPDSLVAVQPNAKSHRLWLKYFLLTKKEYFESKATQNAQANINLQTIRPAVVQLPPLPEQEAIAGVLECWDGGIRNLELKIVKKRLIKKGLMQKLLSGQTRLPGFSNVWKTVKLGQICDIRRGASPRPIKDPKWFSDTGRGWVRISDVTKTKKYLTKTTQYLSPEGEGKSVKVDPGELIMSICATIGVPRIVDVPVCVHDGFVLFQNLQSVGVQFLFHALTEKTDKLSGQGQPGTQKNLNTDIVNRIPLQLPPLEEQQAIAEVLRAADGEIDALEKKLVLWKDQKKYLLNNLVTGSIRLPEFRKAS